MSHGSSRVYVIDTPKEPQAKSAPQETFPPTTPRARARAVPKIGNGKWKPVALAYLCGWITMPFWTTQRARVAWSIISGLSLVTIVVLLVGGKTAMSQVGAVSGGGATWIILTTFSVLGCATAWAVSIVVAGRRHFAQPKAEWLCSPEAVGIIGLLIPGLGLMIAGSPRRAGFAFWTIGPLAAALAILTNSKWLWQTSQSSVSLGISGPALEILFVLFGATAVFAAFFWVTQALDGARLVTNPYTRHSSSVTSVALLVALAALFVTVHPGSVAKDISGVSSQLRASGFQLIPLGMYELSARLDPASPMHLSHAADLNEELGMTEAAKAKRQAIERRRAEYLALMPESAAPLYAPAPPPTPVQAETYSVKYDPFVGLGQKF